MFEMEQQINKWRGIALLLIIFIIVLMTFVTFVFIKADKQSNNKLLCSENICVGNGYTAFFYEYSTNICYCYKDNQIVYQEVIK